ncbi:MAG: VanZ family protein [Lachnospiraceae bacterium]|nr:VanZ family protein [Lachnospiraceae bacterium]
MIRISYTFMVILITILWLAVRTVVWTKQKNIVWKRELQLLLVYVCLIVVTRFTFCPFGKVDGKIQPLVFYRDNWFPFRVNLLPFVYLFDYPKLSEALLNFIGNTTMFIPVGIIWPIVFKKLDTPAKVIGAGIGFSLCIEILQLPFYDRVSDVDDLILNSLGYVIGYGIYCLVKLCKKKPAR